MAAGGEFSGHPGFDYFLNQPGTDDSGPQTKNIGIVMLTTHCRGKKLMTESGPDRPGAIGRHRHADPGPADQDAPISRTTFNGCANRSGKIRIVDRFSGITTKIGYLMPKSFQHFDNIVLDFEAAMITTDRNLQVLTP